MKKFNFYHWKLQPILGIGAYLDQYYKNECGVDGWAYNIIFPFIRIQIGCLYVPEINKQKEQ